MFRGSALNYPFFFISIRIRSSLLNVDFLEIDLLCVILGAHACVNPNSLTGYVSPINSLCGASDERPLSLKGYARVCGFTRVLLEFNLPSTLWDMIFFVRQTDLSVDVAAL